MTEFRIVSDEHREARGPGKRPETQALLDGKTIFIPTGSARSLQSARAFVHNAGKNHGHRAFVRTTTVDGVEGVVGWFGDKR